MRVLAPPHTAGGMALCWQSCGPGACASFPVGLHLLFFTRTPIMMFPLVCQAIFARLQPRPSSPASKGMPGTSCVKDRQSAQPDSAPTALMFLSKPSLAKISLLCVFVRRRVLGSQLRVAFWVPVCNTGSTRHSHLLHPFILQINDYGAVR